MLETVLLSGYEANFSHHGRKSCEISLFLLYEYLVFTLKILLMILIVHRERRSCKFLFEFLNYHISEEGKDLAPIFKLSVLTGCCYRIPLCILYICLLILIGTVVYSSVLRMLSMSCACLKRGEHASSRA